MPQIHREADQGISLSTRKLPRNVLGELAELAVVQASLWTHRSSNPDASGARVKIWFTWSIERLSATVAAVPKNYGEFVRTLLYKWLSEKARTLRLASQVPASLAVDIADQVMEIDVEVLLRHLLGRAPMKGSKDAKHLLERLNQSTYIATESTARAAYRTAALRAWRARRDDVAERLLLARTNPAEAASLLGQSHGWRGGELFAELCGAAGDLPQHSLNLRDWMSEVRTATTYLRGVFAYNERMAFTTILEGLAKGLTVCRMLPYPAHEAESLVRPWTVYSVAARSIGAAPGFDFRALDGIDGEACAVPAWLDAKWYRKSVGPPTIPTHGEIEPYRVGQVASAGDEGVGHGQAHNLAALGIRAQRRYGISKRAWRKRWGGAPLAH
ncbi:hypothetical protein JCM10908_001940 [Rhodotorula pacifica]|uniref:uncharacterized protein n=1 Tax=Rhodotorula pacifica TaxID=1495444 RepID=UPI0031773BA6